MSSLEESGLAKSQSADEEGPRQAGSSGDQNTVRGGATNGGFIFQGGQNQIEVTQYFGMQPTTKESLFTKETIDTDYFEPETILIPEGEFWMGSDPGVGIKEYDTPQHKVSLPIYRISKYPVLNREYAEFITRSETQISAPLVGFSGLRPKDGFEDRPVRGITWEEAIAYCKWLSELTKRQYDIPNEAQLEKAYQGAYGCSDIVEDIYLWTCTLWGEDLSSPAAKYRYPWKKDDGRNNLNANSQIRRVVCRYKKAVGTDRSQRDGRSGQFPKKPLPPERYSFRVVMNV